MASVRFTPAMSALMRSHSAPMHRAEHGDAAVPDGGGEAHRHEGPDRAETDQARERRHHGADAGEKPADEDADDAEAEILALDDGERARREQPPPVGEANSRRP